MQFFQFPPKSDLGQENHNWFKRKPLTFRSTFDDVDAGNPPEVTPKTEEEAAKIYDTIEKATLFQRLEEHQVESLIRALKEMQVEENEIVVRQGETEERMFIVKSGVFESYHSTESGVHKGRLYKESGIFRELALVNNAPAPCWIKALTPGVLWTMDRRTFKSILLIGTKRKREPFENLLASVPMFLVLKPYDRSQLSEALVPLNYQTGERIIKKGDPSYGLYFVLQGSCIATDIVRGREVEVIRFKRNEFFGLIGLIHPGPRPYSVYAANKVRLAFLDEDSVTTILAPCMDIMKRIEREISESYNITT